ncbi:MAG: hypothetical protein OXI96_01785 [Acidimicrobiaceae bacterium]|nr:hypothetical protein [Acidimicrobiaceae bacterium]
MRQRGEKVERRFAHLLTTGGLRRVHIRGQNEIRKRVLIQAAALNLGLAMSKKHGFGTPRALQGLAKTRTTFSQAASTLPSLTFSAVSIVISAPPDRYPDSQTAKPATGSKTPPPEHSTPQRHFRHYI